MEDGSAYVVVKKESNAIRKFAEVCGYLGMVLIHASTLPSIIKILLGYSAILPPIEMVMLVLSGLFLFLIRAVAAKDTLYIISNGIGFFCNALLMSFIIFK